MEAIECLKTRRSIRSYQPFEISREILESIVDCGRLAATANNLQPWVFVVVQDQSTRDKLAAIAEYGKFIPDASACIVVFCEDTKYYLEDGSAATQNIINAAHALGLGSCWVAGDKKPYATQIAELLGAPSNYKLISLIAIGKTRGAVRQTPKKPLTDLIHWDKFQV